MTEKILYDALSSTGYDVFHQETSDNKKAPFVIYNKTTQTIESCLQGNSTVENSRYSVDVYAKTYPEAKTMETAVRDAIENITDAKQIIYSIVPIRESDYSRIRLDVKLWK